MYKFLIMIFVMMLTYLALMMHYNDNSVIKHKRSSDGLYVKQREFLQDCVSKFTEEDLVMLDYYTESWAENPITNNNHMVDMQSRSAIDCLKILSKHQAKKHLCPQFAEKYKDNDHILPHKLKAFEDCIGDRPIVIRNLYLTNQKDDKKDEQTNE